MTTWDDLWTRPEPAATPLRLAPAVDLDPNRASSYAAAALRREAEAVASTAEGSRNDALNRAAFRMGRHVGAGNIDAGVVRDALTQAGLACGLPRDEVELILRDSADSGINRGSEHPRIPAPLASLPGPTVLAARVDAGQGGQGEQGAEAEGAGEGPDVAELIRSRFPLLNFTDLLGTEDEGEEWIVEPLLAVRRLIALYSAPKVGKSLLMLEIAVGIALGTPVLGVTPEPRRVLYVDFENDPRGDIKRRLEAMGYGPEDGERLNAGLCYLSFPSMAKLDTPQGGYELVTAAQEYGCDVVVIDTVSRAVGGEENDNNTWLAFYRDTGLLLKQAGIACIRLDHSGKDADKGMRGGSAKYGDVDAVWRLAAESETVLNLDCTDHRMPVEEERLTLIRETYPTLHHRVFGDRTMALDAREAEIDKALDKLGLDPSTGANECYRRLREAGNGFNKQAVLRVVKARKMRLPETSPGGSGTTPEPPGTTAGSGGSRSPLRSRAPEPPAATGSMEPEPPSSDRMFVVACRGCYRPTHRDVAHDRAGLCETCHDTEEN